jgi:ABC-2 type transport system permease protein
MSTLVADTVRTPRVPRASLLRHAGFLTTRSTKALWRQPAFAVATLVQPIIWLLLFGELFRPVAEIPGFAAAHGSYLEFITPGVVVMTALFSSGWAGTVYIEDMNRGVMDRLLASPVRRGAMMIGTLAYQALTTVLQTLVVVGIALLLRSQEALIGISQFIVLPLQFLSSAIMDTSLSPDWVQTVARYNPVDWAVVAAREALSTGTDWGTVWSRLGLLTALAAVMAWLATRAFGAYQRSM